MAEGGGVEWLWLRKLVPFGARAMTTPTIPQNESQPAQAPPPPAAEDGANWQRLREALSAADVRLEDEADVRAYLAEHTDSYGMVETMCRDVRAEFGPDFQLTLRFYRDMLVPDDTYLQLRVTPPEHAREGTLLDRMHALAEAHEDLRYGKSGWLVVTPFYPRRG
jgi:hypothetical protein